MVDFWLLHHVQSDNAQVFKTDCSIVSVKVDAVVKIILDNKD